ncbi:MAG: tetratricopeptide repeat protein [Planctomycetia bacterium]|nr:tetratricopeptide repeat protein [Planctomycetia bacterium]
MVSKAESRARQPADGRAGRGGKPVARPGGADRTTAVLAGAVLVAVTFLAYAPVLRNAFVWDDDDYIVNNANLRSLDGLWRIWCVPRSLPQYYPLVHTTFWVEHRLWGADPVGYHLVNVLLHGAAAVLVWRLLVRLKAPGAWLAAALFAVHPVCVESVAWATERKNVLAGVLALASLLAYFRFATPEEDPAVGDDRARWRYYRLALALYVAGLLAKTVVVSVPAVILVVVWWKRGRIAWRDLGPLVPFFVLGAGLGLVTVWIERHQVGASGAEWELSFVDRVLVAGRALWFYAGKLAWPHPLIFFYPRWEIDAHEWWQYVFPVASLGIVVALWLLRERVGRGPLAAVLIFAGVLAPALGFFDIYPMRFSFVADHFQYHACLALLALAAAAAATVAARLGRDGRNIGVAVAGGVLVTLAALTARQAGFYRDVETLFRHAIDENPSSWIAHLNLSVHLQSQGRLAEALDLGREAVRLNPAEARAQSNMGVLLSRQDNPDRLRPGQLEQAIAYLREAVRLRPDFAEAQANIGTLLFQMGQGDRFRPGQLDEAIGHLNEAVRLRPDDAEMHSSLAVALIGNHQTQEGIEHFARALEIQPDNAEARYNLAVVLLGQGEVDRAIEHLEQVIRLQPDDSDAKVQLHKARAVKRQSRGS